MGSSSKAKSSKKKSSKIHSQPRKMKRGKKSRSSKSKKVARRHDTSSDDSMSSQSISSASNDSSPLYSDSDSMSSVSFSSSSTEGTYRGKKKVSRLRSKLKSTRKKVRRRSSISEDFSRKKKRKGSRNADSKSWKKSKKNKSRRNMSNSSATSDSHCSTCKEESGSLSEDSQVQKLMFKSRENKTHKRESREERVGTKKRSHRSRSSSSYSRFRDQSYSGSRGDGIFVDENKSRRLRSVIIFAEQAYEKEGNKSGKDSPKEEIVYDCDDCPSPRSNDSSSKGSKRDVNSHPPVALGDRRQKENGEGQETCVSNIRVAEVTESRKNANDPKVHDPFWNEVEMNIEKENRTYGSVLDANLGADDLEAVLRQKALENLRKFRGGIQRNVKAANNQINNVDEDAKESFSSKAEIVQRVLPKQDNTASSMERSSRTTSSTGGVSYPHKDVADSGNTVTESGIAKQNATHPPHGLAFSGSSLKEDHMATQAAVVKSESQNSVFGEKASRMNSSLIQETILQSSPDKKLNENRESERKNLPKTTNSITSGITNNSEAVVNDFSSEQSTSQGQGSNLQQNEFKDGAQFEQKTMSVMRGGEMVQVNYKVYIPKRAPALSRRQLKR